MKNRLLISRRACFNPFLSNSMKSFAAAVTRFHHQGALQNSIRDVNCIFFFFSDKNKALQAFSLHFSAS